MRKFLKEQKLARLKENLKRDITDRNLQPEIYINGMRSLCFNPRRSYRNYTTAFCFYGRELMHGSLSSNDHVEIRIKDF